MFKIKCDLPELRPLDAQDTVKIVTVILSVIHYESDLRADWFLAQIYLRNPHLPALKCSTHVGNFFCSECL